MEGETYIPGPDFEHKLTHVDVGFPFIWSKRIYCFRQQDSFSNERIIEVLTNGLQRLVNRVPILAGVITTEKESKQPTSYPWKYINPGPGLLLITKHLEDSFDFAALQAEGFPVRKMEDHLLIPLTGVRDFNGTKPATAIQANFVKGGLLLSVCITHIIADGNAMNVMVDELSKECRRYTEGETSTLAPLNVNNEWAATIRSDEYADAKHHDAYEMKYGPPPPEADPPEYTKDELYLPKIYRISAENLQALKKYSAGSEIVSSHDSLIALCWRAIMKVRVDAGLVQNGPQLTGLYLPTNGRKAGDIALDFIGNAVSQVAFFMPLNELLEDETLHKAVTGFRNTIKTKADSAHFKAIMQLQRDLEYPKRMRWGGLTDPHLGNVVFGSSWKDNVYSQDWGPVLGKVQSFRTSHFGLLGPVVKSMGFVLPKLADGTMEFELYVNDDIEKRLQEDKLFTKYIEKLEA